MWVADGILDTRRAISEQKLFQAWAIGFRIPLSVEAVALSEAISPALEDFGISEMMAEVVYVGPEPTRRGWSSDGSLNFTKFHIEV